MATDQDKPIGFLVYDMCPKAGGTPFPSEMPVYSTTHADTLYNMLSEDKGKLVYSNFKLIGHDKTEILKEYLKKDRAKKLPSLRRTAPSKHKGKKQ